MISYTYNIEIRNTWPNPNKMKKEIFSTFCRKVKRSKRYVVWESTRVISFYLSVCYCKWWRHHIDGLNHIDWGNFQNYLLSFIPFFLKIFLQRSNMRICVLRFMGELCRPDLWSFFFERPHFHNRSEFNRPCDSAAICYYF